MTFMQGAKTAAKVVLWLLGLIAVGLGLWLAYSDKAASAAAALSAGFMLMLLSAIERFELIEALGVKAKMRETIAEAKSSIDEVREMLRTLAEFSFQTMARQGRLRGPMPREVALKIAHSLKDQLARAGISELEIERAEQPWTNTIALDLMRPAIEGLHQRLVSHSVRMNDELSNLSSEGHSLEPRYARLIQTREQLNKVIEPIVYADRADVRAIPTILRNAISSTPNELADDREGMRQLIEPALREAEHYLRTREFLDRRAFLESDPFKSG